MTLSTSDDRLGPYALAQLATASPDQQLLLNLNWPNGKTEHLGVFLAAVPLYPKLRSAAHELFESAIDLFPIVKELFSQPEDELAVEFFFERSGRYLADLYRMPASPDRLIRFFQVIALSRYVGIVRWFLNGNVILDTLWDTTDRLRETRFGEHLLGLVAFGEADRKKVDRIGKKLGTVVG